jgi:hypothetical protein
MPALSSERARGDDRALVFQYKVLSVLPGSGMGIAVSTPSTQKVSARQVAAKGRGVALNIPGLCFQHRKLQLHQVGVQRT